MGERGPEPQTINFDEFEKLLSYQCTQIEIAHFFNISVDTLDRICRRELGEKLADIWDKKKNMGKVRLRKIQFDIAESGGPGAATMAIFLGKVILGQRDKDPEIPQVPQNSPSNEVEKIEVPKKSFEEFCECAGYPRPYPKQVEMRDFAFNESDPRMLLGARGYGKTDYMTILGTAYDIYINGVSTSNLIISKSKSRNTAMMNEIAAALVANGVELEKENASCVRIAGLIGKDHSAEAITIKTSMRGRHPKRTLMDDPVTEEDVSEAMRQLVKRKYNEVMKLCSNVVVIGQPAHQYDLYAELRPMLKKIEMPYGTIPELDHDLEAQRLAGVDETSIQASYFLKVVTDGSSIFSNLKFIDSMPTGNSVAFIDPSDGGDYTAVSIVKGFMDGVAAEGYAWKKAWYHCLDDMLIIFQALGVKKLCFETNKTGTHCLIQLREVFNKIGIGVTGKNSDSNKHAVIQSAGSYAHMIHLSKKSMKIYTDQVVQYEYGAKFDDSPDSLARCLEWLGLLKGKK